MVPLLNSVSFIRTDGGTQARAGLDGEQTQPEPTKPRIAPYVMDYFQVANEAIVRIATTIPKARAGDFRDMMAIRASLEQMEKRIGSEYDMS